jgi:hypothetical protein
MQSSVDDYSAIVDSFLVPSGQQTEVEIFPEKTITSSDLRASLEPSLRYMGSKSSQALTFAVCNKIISQEMLLHRRVQARIFPRLHYDQLLDGVHDEQDAV